MMSEPEEKAGTDGDNAEASAKISTGVDPNSPGPEKKEPDAARPAEGPAVTAVEPAKQPEPAGWRK